MTDERTPQPDPTIPTSDLPTTEPMTDAKTPTHWRTRRWLAGATLVTVGLAAGGGATYAFTATNNDGAGPGTSAVGYGPPAGAPGGAGGRTTGTPPGGSDDSDGGTTTDSQPT